MFVLCGNRSNNRKALQHRGPSSQTSRPINVLRKIRSSFANAKRESRSYGTGNSRQSQIAGRESFCKYDLHVGTGQSISALRAVSSTCECATTYKDSASHSRKIILQDSCNRVLQDSCNTDMMPLWHQRAEHKRTNPGLSRPMPHIVR